MHGKGYSASAFAKNYLAVGFTLDYVKADGVDWIVEIKGREELDLPQKMARRPQ